MRVVVITLAIPRPCGTISNHKWNEEVSSFHITTSIAAATVIAQETKVRVYSLPVRRMILTIDISLLHLSE